MRESRYLEFKETVETNSFLKTVSAFANFDGGKIIFGIKDDGTVIGVIDPVKACLNLENKINDSIDPSPSFTLEISNDQTIVLEVFKGNYTPYLYKGKAYKRNDSSTIEVSRPELNQLILKGENQTFEEQVSLRQDLSFKELEKELAQSKGIGEITSDILRALGLLDGNIFNNAAAIIADSNEFLGIDVIRFKDNINELMERQTFDHTSIFNMYHQTLAIYQKYYCYEKIEGSKRIKKELVPKEAFREALANALVHRMWDFNSRVRISMFKDKIEISSPGGLPYGLSKEEYLDGQISLLRNPIIGNIFFTLGYIEMFGSGIKRIKDAYRERLTSPEFKIYDNSITVILPLSDKDIKLAEDEKGLLERLPTSSVLSRSQIEELTNYSKPKTIRILNSLSQKGLIQKIGSGPNVKYLKKYYK